jgi:RND family efflux transporter MFP subunit
MTSIRANLRKYRLWIAAGALLILIAVCWACFFRGAKANPDETFIVQRGEFLDVLQFRGEIKAMKAVGISAPSNAGDLQIVRIASDGTRVHAGDVVVEFDASRTQQSLAQGRSTLKSAQAEIDQMRAQGLLTEQADATALAKSGYDLDVSKLDASKGEVVSAIEGAEAALKVADNEQGLSQARVQLEADKKFNAAVLTGKRQASNKARYDETRLENAMNSMTVKAPVDGVLSLIPVWHNGSEAPFKAGDRAWSGSPIAELPDATSLRVSARVDETERGSLSIGQPVTIQLDAISDTQFTGHIDHIGTIASTDFSAGWPFPRNFDLKIAIDQTDGRLKPGMTAQVTVILNRIPNAISIPTQAVFARFGQMVAYVWTGKRYEERLIQVEKRSRERALISRGLAAGDHIALKEPK